LNKGSVHQNASDLDSVKLTTETLGNELKQLRKQLHEMQMNGSEKDAEIIKLNMHLADEKKKTQEAKRGQRSFNKSISNKSLRNSSTPVRLNQKSSVKDTKGRKYSPPDPNDDAGAAMS